MNGQTHRAGLMLNRVVEVLTRYAKIPPPPQIVYRSTTARPRKSGRTHIHTARRRLSAVQIAQLADDYRTGRSTTWLMQTYSLGKGTVLSLLEEQGVAMRGQGVTDEQIAEASQRYRAGASLMTLTKHFDASAETIRRALLDTGVQLRKRWERGPT